MENSVLERKPYEAPQLLNEDTISNKVNANPALGSTDSLFGDGRCASAGGTVCN